MIKRLYVVKQRTVEELFPPETLTRWQERDIQRFELEVDFGNGTYVYKLEIGHIRHEQKCRVRVEELKFKDKAIFELQQHLSDEQGMFQQSVSFRFDELSDGQRALIALYTLLHFVAGKDTTICIDEPDNYVALREIQPWLMEINDACVDRDAQLLFISHHPELIDLLALEKGILFERLSGSGPVRTKPFSKGGHGLDPSEAIARGWNE